MRRFYLLFVLAVMFATSVSAQTPELETSEKTKFSIKVQPFKGSYLDQNSHFEKFRPFAPSGVNLGFQLPSDQQRPWQQYLNNATLGFGLSFIDFGHQMVGYSVTAYPYILIPAVRLKHFEMELKFASGLGYVTEHWYTGNVDPNDYEYYGDDVNTLFGCYINAYLSAGAAINIPITRNFALNGEFGYLHMSNGRTNMPNMGINVTYGAVGVIATFNEKVKKEPIQFPDLPYGWTLNFTGAAGIHQAWMYHPKYLISSFHTGAVYSVNNWYGLGLGMDVFYNDAVDSNTGRNLYCHGKFVPADGGEDCLSCDGEYTLSDKIRAGVSINNEFRMGVVTAIVDWGVYFRNPSRNLYYDYHLESQADGGITGRKLFYKSPGAGSEEMFHYIRFGMKYRIWDNLYFQASAKTHLHICEFVEFGLNYQIPFLKKGNRSEGKSIIFHNSKDWWKK